MKKSSHTFKNDNKTYRRLLEYLKPYKVRFAVSFFTSIPASILNGGVAFLVGPLFDTVIQEQNYSILKFIPIGIMIILAFQALFEYISSYASVHVATSITRDLRRDLFASLSKMDLSFYKQNTSGELFNRYYKDPVQLEQAIVNNLQGFIIQFFTALFLATVLIYRNYQLAIIAMVIMSVIVIPISFISKKIRKQDYELLEIGAGLYNRFNESIIGAKIIQAFNLGAYQRKRFNKASINFFSGTIRIQRTSIMLKPIIQLIAGLGISSILFVGALQVQNGVMTLGDLASFVIALILLYKPVKVIGGIFGKIQRILAPAERVFEVLDRVPEVRERANPTLPLEINKISFKDVYFEYEEDKPILKKVNFTVNRGETIAFVGSSGGGKSTMADLVPRFMDVTSGAVLVNNINVNELSVHGLRSLISVVSQETILFEGSIRDNIKLGKLNATDEEIKESLESAHLSAWVSALPEGLNTPIGERGSLISGGQKQRIAIARAFLKNAPLLILDEATSALDNESEAIVQKALARLMKGKTVIVIAHRLSTIQHANRIMVIEKGEIVETGSHEELLNKKSQYYRFHQLQFENNLS